MNLPSDGNCIVAVSSFVSIDDSDWLTWEAGKDFSLALVGVFSDSTSIGSPPLAVPTDTDSSPFLFLGLVIPLVGLVTSDMQGVAFCCANLTAIAAASLGGELMPRPVAQSRFLHDF